MHDLRYYWIPVRYAKCSNNSKKAEKDVLKDGKYAKMLEKQDAGSGCYALTAWVSATFYAAMLQVIVSHSSYSFLLLIYALLKPQVACLFTLFHPFTFSLFSPFLISSPFFHLSPFSYLPFLYYLM